MSRTLGRRALPAILLALACRDALALCVMTSVERALPASEAVIEAEVVGIRPGDPRGWTELALRPTRVWKASKSDPRAVVSVDSPERPPFETGKTYLMFIGKRSDGRLAIGKCSPLTQEVRLAKKEIEELERLTSRRPHNQ